MQRLEVSGAVRHIHASLGVKGLNQCSERLQLSCTIQLWDGK